MGWMIGKLLKCARGMTYRHYQRRRFFFCMFFPTQSAVFLFLRCSLLVFEFLERRSLMHGQMVGRVAFDQILRLLLRGADSVALERDGRGDLFLDCSTNMAGLRVPPHMISHFKALLRRPRFH